MPKTYSRHNKPVPGDFVPDLYVAKRNLRRAQHDHAMAKRAFAPHAQVTFNGDPSEPKWDARCKAQHALISAEYTRKNLEKLIKLDDSGMCRRLGFNDFGTLVIDGDWICDFDSNGDEMCIDCAKRLLLVGGFDPESAWAYLLYVDQPDYTVVCSECKRELWHVDTCPECGEPNEGGEVCEVCAEKEEEEEDTEDVQP